MTDDGEGVVGEGREDPGLGVARGVVGVGECASELEAGRQGDDGFARAIYPVHTPADGDIVFALSIGDVTVEDDDLLELGVVAANAVTRAIAVGVYHGAQGGEM